MVRKSCLAETGFRQIKVNYRRRIITFLFTYCLKCFTLNVQNCMALSYIE